MLNIALIRIDERLIHGQIILKWLKLVQGNRIILIDDNIAHDPIMKNVFRMATSFGIIIDVYDIQKSIVVLLGESKPEEKVVILTKNPNTIKQLFDRGIKIKEISIGGMLAGRGKKKVHNNMWLSEQDIEGFNYLLNKGVIAKVQIVPDSETIFLSKLLKTSEGK